MAALAEDVDVVVAHRGRLLAKGGSCGLALGTCGSVAGGSFRRRAVLGDSNWTDKMPVSKWSD